MSEDTNRGTGRTARQMMSAPHSAVYFCPGSQPKTVLGSVNGGYFSDLATALGRPDLVLRDETALDDRYKLMALDVEAVVFDHAIDLGKTAARSDNVAFLNECADLYQRRTIQRLKERFHGSAA